MNVPASMLFRVSTWTPWLVKQVNMTPCLSTSLLPSSSLLLLPIKILFLTKFVERKFVFFNFDISIQLRVTAKHAWPCKSAISFFVRYMALAHSRVLPNCRGSNHFLFFTISFSLTFIQSLRLYKLLEKEIVESIKHNKTISEKVETEKIFASIKLK